MITSTALRSAVVAALALGLAGCGNGLQVAPPAAPPTPSATSTSPEPSPEPSSDPSSDPSDTPSTSTSPSSRPTASVPTGTAASCTLADLKVGLSDSAGGGAAGSSYVLLTFTNAGDQNCTLYGYPGVSWVGKGNGTQIGAAAARADGAKKTVTLAAGDQTTAVLRIVQAGNYGATCTITKTDGFRVYPPGETKAAFVRSAGTGCANDKVTVLEVSPVGTTG